MTAAPSHMTGRTVHMLCQLVAMPAQHHPRSRCSHEWIVDGTQVSSRPPSFTLFVNDPKLFGDTYRRYVERQIREGLGFDGTPVKLFWRGKQQRDAERDIARQQNRQA